MNTDAEREANKVVAIVVISKKKAPGSYALAVDDAKPQSGKSGTK